MLDMERIMYKHLNKIEVMTKDQLLDKFIEENDLYDLLDDYEIEKLKNLNLHELEEYICKDILDQYSEMFDLI